MHADVFGHILEHHGLQVLDAMIEEVTLSIDDRLADTVYRLTPVLDVLQQIDRRSKPLLYVVAGFL